MRDWAVAHRKVGSGMEKLLYQTLLNNMLQEITNWKLSGRKTFTAPENWTRFSITPGLINLQSNILWTELSYPIVSK